MFSKLNGYLGKIFFRSLISFTAILIAGVIIVSAIYSISYKIIKEEIERTNYAMLEQTMMVMDNIFKDIDNIGQQVLMNSRIQNFSIANKDMTNIDRYRATEIINDIRFYKMAYRYIEGIYIYFKNSEVIITPDSMWNTVQFYNKVYCYKQMDYKTWKDIILYGCHNKTLYSSMTLIYNFPDFGQQLNLSDDKEQNIIEDPIKRVNKQVLTYCQSFPLGSKQNWKYNLVVLINEESFKNLFKNMSNSDRAVGYIIGKDNRILTATRNNFNESLKYDEMPGDRGLAIRKINGEEMVVSYVKSEIADRKYVSIFPTGHMMKSAIDFRNISLMILIVFFFVGTGIALFLAYLGYSPIKAIVDMINRKILLNNSQKPTGYNYKDIKQMIENTLDENINYKTKVPALKNEFVLKLVRGDINELVDIEDYLKMLNLSFRVNIFKVMLIKFNKSDSESAHSREKIYEILTGLEYIHQICFFDFSSDITGILLNLAENLDSPDKDGLSYAADKLLQVLRQINISATIASGDTAYSVWDIKTSFQQAMDALNYRIIKGNDTVIHYKEISFNKNRQYDYPLELENRLICLVKAGNFQDVKSLISQVFEKNSSIKDQSVEIVRCFMFDMVSTVLKSLYELHEERTEAFEEKFDPISYIMECETLEELYNTILNIYKILCEYIGVRKESHNSTLMTNIKKYIDNSLGDQNLSLNMVAEKLNVSPSYLSRFFKEQTGDGFLNYVNKSRIDKAKLIIESNGDISISQVADSIGLSNTNALIRLFKKYYAITPGQYREQLFEKNNCMQLNTLSGRESFFKIE